MESTILGDVIDAPSKHTLSRKEQVVALLSSIESGDSKAMSLIDAAHFKQHNLTVADGVEGFGEMLAALALYPEAPRVNCLRVIEDGDFVATHTDYNLFGERVGFDIFRFEGGKIVEHWDNLQAKPKRTNPSGHTMIDGTTRINDILHTEKNRKLVERFVREVLIGCNYSRIALYFDGDNYTQHNPMVGDGLSAFGVASAKMARDGITMSFSRLHKVIAEGDFVLTVTEGLYGKEGGEPTSYYDLFRVHRGKIAEHWDVMERITPEKERKNSNGKFGF